MKSSLQSRVLALVGAGVFIAGVSLSLLSRYSLLSLEREVTHDHERLAASLAREVSRALGHDLRLLATVAGAPDDRAPALLGDMVRFGQLASAAFVVDAGGTVVMCQPVFECDALPHGAIAVFARAAITGQRPAVSNALPNGSGAMRVIGILPLRSVEGRAAGAAGLSVDPQSRRMTELLEAADIAPTLRLSLTDGDGHLLTAVPSAAPADAHPTDVAVTGTPWRLALTDAGPDPLEPIAVFRRRSLWLAPTLAAVAMLLGWGIARSVRRPLLQLTKAAERIAQGDLARPVDVRRAAYGGDEVARLALALERMRTELQTSIGEIETSNRELEERVTARTAELAAANVSLEQRERGHQRLLRQVISAQEDERKRVARELHDETSQTLAALGIGVDMALAAPGEAARQRLVEIRRLVTRMHHEVNRLIVNLRPSVLDDLGLGPAIQWLADRQLTAAGITVRCELTGLDERLPAEIETAVFRAVQEAISNIARHAQAESVLIQASLEDGRLLVEIEDDGVGFDPSAVVRTPDSLRGVGLLGIRERMDILGGHVRIDSAPGSGTSVVLDVGVGSASRSGQPVTG
jgi:signal transduction histidine kinase